MEFEPHVSANAWAALSIIRKSVLVQVRAQVGIGAFAELERVGFVRDGEITEKGIAALRRRKRLG